MSLLEAARQALPGIAWEQVSSNGVEYVYGEGSKDSYGVFDLADIAKITAELKADRDALDADLDETPRAVLTDELTALRERMRWRDMRVELPQPKDLDRAGCVMLAALEPETGKCPVSPGWLDDDIWRWLATGEWALATHWQPMPAAPEVQNG